MEDNSYIYNLDDVGEEEIDDEDSFVEAIIVDPYGEKLVLISSKLYGTEPVLRTRELARHKKAIRTFMHSSRVKLTEEDTFFSQFY